MLSNYSLFTVLLTQSTLFSRVKSDRTAERNQFVHAHPILIEKGYCTIDVQVLQALVYTIF